MGGLDAYAYLPTGGFQFNPDVQPKSLYQQQSVVAGLTGNHEKIESAMVEQHRKPSCDSTI